MGGNEFTTALTDLGDAIGRLLDADPAGVSDREFALAWVELERLRRVLATAMECRMVVEASVRNLAGDTKYRSLNRYLRALLGLSSGEAYDRIRNAERFGRRTDWPTATDGDDDAHGDGEPVLVSRYPRITQRLHEGALSLAQTAAVGKALAALPATLPHDDRAVIEQALADIAPSCSPDDITDLTVELLAELHPDAPLGDPAERARRRGFTVSAPDATGMAKVSGWWDVTLLAMWDVYRAKFAQPGWCLPEHPDPAYSEAEGVPPLDPAEHAVLTKPDKRTPAQRNHDALHHLLRMGLEGFPPDGLGTFNGFPMTVIATTTVEDLEHTTGLATTATGRKIPVRDLLTMARQFQPYLCVIDGAERPLYLGRGTRTATLDQRLALTATETGCSGPACRTPALHTQVHHRTRDWQSDGRTDIHELTLACKPQHAALDDNDGEREPDGWYTTVATAATAEHLPGAVEGQTLWIPPASVDPLRRPLINTRHTPRRILGHALATRQTCRNTQNRNPHTTAHGDDTTADAEPPLRPT